MAESAASSSLTPRDYLTMEREASTKHEYWNGEVFAMAGASFVHNVIVGNLVRELGVLVLDRPCVVLPSDMKVHVPTRSSGFVYPDLSIVCGTPQFFDDTTDVLVNPSVIIEVLSDSTERFDRGEKFAGYRLLPSLREVLLVTQHAARVEHYVRETVDSETWRLRSFSAGQRLQLVTLEGELAVDDIYAKVEWAKLE